MAEKSKALAGGFALPKPPKRTPVPEPEAERFVEAMELAETQSVRRRSPKESKLRRASRGERVAVYLPPEIVEQLRIRCVQERRSVSDAVSDAVTAWLKPRK